MGGGGHGPVSKHDAVWLLNTADREANVELRVYFADRDPLGPYRVRVPPRRTLHLSFDELTDPRPIPAGTEYACVLESDLPIVVQHSSHSSDASESASRSPAYPLAP